MKYGFPLGHAMTYLAWSMIDYRAAYVAAGELQNGLDSVRWGTDFILKVRCPLIFNEFCLLKLVYAVD